LKRRKGERKLAMARARKRRMRAKAREMRGGQTREEYLANSLTATRPWEALGISRRTLECRKAADKAAKRVTSTGTPLLIIGVPQLATQDAADISNRLAA
jgi:hypothetical protein